ncbi:MAG: asparagine synthase-related protein [Thermoplasmata archaeon]
MLAEALSRAVERGQAGVSGGVLAFSGGLDSSLLALLMARQGRAPELCTVGLKGARDLAAAERAASLLGLEGRTVALVVEEGDVLEAVRRLRSLLPSATMMELAFTIPLFIVCARTRERVIFTGDGADELFGGYHRYLRMRPGELESALRADLERLIGNGIQRHRAIARSFGRELVTPYLDDEVVELARRIPPSEKVAGGERKLVLREAARLLGLPEELRGAPKRAAQYGSGVMKVLEKHSAFC